MKDEFAPRDTIPLSLGTVVTHPEKLPELVHLNDPAATVFTDFTKEHPITIGPDVSIQRAMEKMKNSGICVLLVTDEEQHLLGEITADEIMGDKPVRLTKSNGMSHSDITVSMIMTPAHKVRVLEIEHLRDARVGHIIETLKALESRHVLVIENGSIRGLYRAGQISQQLGHNIMDDEMPAHTLAEIVHSLG
ncbi:MAG: CBS domain-containing protein [Gammaproteobacteria bacterium]|jgi:CBS domain-containing protein|nr:CBS domain-containing protein [Gammaproteobacteria bacterium]